MNVYCSAIYNTHKLETDYLFKKRGDMAAYITTASRVE